MPLHSPSLTSHPRAALYFRSYAAAAARFGKTYSFEEVHYALLGRPEHVGATAFVRILGLEGVTSPEGVLEVRDEVLVREMEHVDPLPGATRVVEGICGRVPSAIATSSSRAYLELKRRRNPSIFSVDHVVCGDDEVMRGKKGKPSPDIFLAAASLLGVEPSKCVVFEDSVAGVQAGKAAGMFVVAVPDPRVSPEEMEAALPDLVLRSLEDFDPAVIGIGGGKEGEEEKEKTGEGQGEGAA